MIKPLGKAMHYKPMHEVFMQEGAMHPESMHQDLPRPFGSVDARRMHSIRRTCSLEVTWPQGRQHTRRVDGIGRDVYTSENGASIVLALDHLSAEFGGDLVLRTIEAQPDVAGLSRLLGIERPGILREALRELVDNGAMARSPLRMLIDDLPGLNVVADWAWSRWPQFLPSEEGLVRKSKLSEMEGVCAGFISGSSALATEGAYQDFRAAIIGSPVSPADPSGWHALHASREVSLRRARCMDVWIDDEGCSQADPEANGKIHIEAFMQDSASTPAGERMGVHEYSVHVTADAGSEAITSIGATPHILPFVECTGAIGNLDRLLGIKLTDLDGAVREQLRRTSGCTHLNDTIRMLVDAADLVARVRAESGRPA